MPIDRSLGADLANIFISAHIRKKNQRLEEARYAKEEANDRTKLQFQQKKWEWDVSRETGKAELDRLKYDLDLRKTDIDLAREKRLQAETSSDIELAEKEYQQKLNDFALKQNEFRLKTDQLENRKSEFSERLKLDWEKFKFKEKEGKGTINDKYAQQLLKTQKAVQKAKSNIINKGIVGGSMGVTSQGLDTGEELTEWDKYFERKNQIGVTEQVGLIDGGDTTMVNLRNYDPNVAFELGKLQSMAPISAPKREQTTTKKNIPIGVLNDYKKAKQLLSTGKADDDDRNFIKLYEDKYGK